MKKLPRPKLSYANLMATLALFIALGGVSYAAVKVPKNSVGTEQLKKNSVATGKVRNGAITGVKIDLSTLGTVPYAGKAETAANASHASAADSASTATNASHATNADEATHAGTADSASNATHADEATHAGTADSASDATHATDADELGGVAADQYLTAGSILPSGRTEVGIFVVAARNGSHAFFAINFHLRLPVSVDEDHVERISNGTPISHPECPGPRQAAPGYFCFYETNSNMQFEGFASPFGEAAPISPQGTIVEWTSQDDGGNARGSWAYTAA